MSVWFAWFMSLAVVFGAVAESDVTDRSATRFTTVDIYLDSGDMPLAAYQLQFKATEGEVKIVGIEGGEHDAFSEPPYYDPEAIQRERVIIAAFNTSDASQLPAGRTRVATIHLTGDRRNVQPQYQLSTSPPLRTPQGEQDRKCLRCRTPGSQRHEKSMQ